jgi:hypothetical protein
LEISKHAYNALLFKLMSGYIHVSSTVIEKWLVLPPSSLFQSQCARAEMRTESVPDGYIGTETQLAFVAPDLNQSINYHLGFNQSMIDRRILDFCRVIDLTEASSVLSLLFPSSYGIK